MKKFLSCAILLTLLCLSGLCLARPDFEKGPDPITASNAPFMATSVACGNTGTANFLQCGSGGGDDPPCDLGTGTNQGPCSPIILDLSGEGFFLTNAENGVMFDIAGNGKPIQIAWIASSADNGFLALPGPDGLVHNGKELFGNFTPQPKSAHPNGFLALGVYDLPSNGGNGDGIVDARDKIFASLRIWIDANHDGICQPEELHTLPSKGVDSVSLNYHFSMHKDRYGNLFRYRAKVNPDDRGDTSEVGRTAYDVFFTTAK